MYPYILVSVALTLLFAFGCRDALKKHGGVFYLAAVLIVILEIIYYRLGIRDLAPEWLTVHLVNFFKRGALPTAMFMVVMYLGALDGTHPPVRKLTEIRGELSILACILTLGHNIIYGLKHFVTLFTNPAEMKPNVLAAALLSLIMIAIMLPLMITSFKAVRGRMQASRWKGLQRLAYLFFALIYVHVMVLFVPKADKKLADILIYTAIFALYLVLRLRKAARRRSGSLPS